MLPAETFCHDPHQCACPPLEGTDELNFQHYFSCPSFWLKVRDLARQDAEIQVKLPAAALIYAHQRLEELEYRLEVTGRETEFLRDVGLFLQRSLGRDEVITMALTAITASKGYGLNRAILFLVDEQEERLNGYLAVGPRSAAEGWQIWNELSQRDETLEEMALRFLAEKLHGEQARFRDLLDGLSVSLAERQHPFIATLESGCSRHILEPWNEPGLLPHQAELLCCRELVMVPLISGARRIGLLLADNIVTGVPIDPQDLRRLETFALPLSYAIERSALYERLHQELHKLTEAHEQLRAQQEAMMRMEKLSLIGEMSADIAHRIRNPLTIIGGYTRRLLKKGEIGEEVRQVLEIILRQCDLIGTTTSELLTESDQLHPPHDRWNMGNAIAAALLSHAEKLRQSGILCHFEPPAGEVMALFDLKKFSYCLKIIIDRCIESLPAGSTFTIGLLREDGAFRVSFALADETSGGERPQVRARDIELALVVRLLEEEGGKFLKEERSGEGVTYMVVLPDNEEKNHGQIAFSR